MKKQNKCLMKCQLFYRQGRFEDLSPLLNLTDQEEINRFLKHHQLLMATFTAENM